MSGSSVTPPQRRINRPKNSPSRSALKHPIVSPDRLQPARRSGRIPFSQCQQATVLFLVGAVCALALLGYGSILTGINTGSGENRHFRPGKGGQGAIYGARGTAGAARRHGVSAPAANKPGSRHVEAPNQFENNDDEIPAKPDDLVEIGHKARKGKDPTKGEKPRKSEVVSVEVDQPKAGGDFAVIGKSENKDTCSFRRYPPDRLYGLGKPLSEQPDFLSKASYIRGELPVIIHSEDNAVIKSQSAAKKICIDSSSWDSPRDGQRPFSDGQNPSLVSLSSDPYSIGNDRSSSQKVRLDPRNLSALGDVYGPEKIHEMYLGVTLVGNAQCKWKMNPEMAQEYGFSALNEAPDRRTLILVLDNQLNTEGQSTLMIERDAAWGKGRRALKAQVAKSSAKGHERSAEFFDDPRLFFHNGEPYVLYRQGPRFGYNDQIQNPLHFEAISNVDGSRSFAAYVKASETFTVCCGRNIALISDDEMFQDKSSIGDSMLRALTWVDPVTVVDVDTGMGASQVDGAKKRRRRLTQSCNEEVRRQLRSGGRGKHHKSNIHGTNGYMIPLHSTSEVLGIAHFHRPENRDTSEYALHGHHYTHALFTIARLNAADASGGAGNVKYRLKRLSNEFVFRSMSTRSETDKAKRSTDADIIQFASGLDLIGSDTDGRLLISYGINDCEGAAIFLDMKDVQEMLIDVPEGNQVVDLMAAPNP